MLLFLKLAGSHDQSPLLTIGKLYTISDTNVVKTHLQFCKRYLEVSNKASNVACRAELGRLPLNITINQKILNYILYIKSKHQESFVREFFLISFDLYSNGKSTFHSRLMEISEYFNLPGLTSTLIC